MENDLPKKIPKTYFSYLKEIYDKRKTKNPAYSFRAYARDIGISSGHLSDIFSGKVGLSLETAARISHNLNLDNEEKYLFLILVKIFGAKNHELEVRELENKLYNYDASCMVLQDEYLNDLTEWYCFALAELIALDDFKEDVLWIAQRLDIDEKMAISALERIKKIGLATVKEGKLVQTYDYFVSPSGTSSDVVKKIHEQVLVKAIDAIFKQSIEERNFTAGFLRVRKKDIPLVERRIKEFRRELVKELESGEEHDSIYNLAIQFFRADQDLIHSDQVSIDDKLTSITN